MSIVALVEDPRRVMTIEKGTVAEGCLCERPSWVGRKYLSNCRLCGVLSTF